MSTKQTETEFWASHSTALKKENIRFRAALEKYANYANWLNTRAGIHEFDIHYDEPWKIARDALEM